MAGQADDPRVEGEERAAELRAEGGFARDGEQALLPGPVAVDGAGVGAHVAAGRRRDIGEVIEGARGGELQGFQVALGARAADDHGEVVRRAAGHAEGSHPAPEERLEGCILEQGAVLLRERGLVGRAAALGDEQQPVAPAAGTVDGRGVDVDLGGEVGARGLVVEERHGRDLREPEIAPRVRVADAVDQCGLVVGARVHAFTLEPDDRGGSGVLAGREHAFGGDRCVGEERRGHVPVVGRGRGIVEDGGPAREVGRAVEEVDVPEGLEGELPQHGGVHAERGAAGGGTRGGAVRRTARDALPRDESEAGGVEVRCEKLGERHAAVPPGAGCGRCRL